MKNLLTTLATLSLATSVVTPIAQQIVNKSTATSSVLERKEIYWYADHSKTYEFVNGYEVDMTYQFYFIQTIDLGASSVTNYSMISVIDPGGQSYTRTTWGSSNYNGQASRDRISYSPISSVFHANTKITNRSEAVANSNITLLNVEDRSGLAWFASNHKVGLSYYSEGGKNYMQLFGTQYVDTSTTFSGGYATTNFGRGFVLQ